MFVEALAIRKIRMRDSLTEWLVELLKLRGKSDQTLSWRDAGLSLALSVFEKRVNNHWVLRKRAYAGRGHSVGRGVYFDTHELFNSRIEEVVSKMDWEWAELDGARLIWAANDCLHSGLLDVKGLHSEKLLHDFSSMQFEKLVAPH